MKTYLPLLLCLPALAQSNHNGDLSVLGKFDASTAPWSKPMTLVTSNNAGASCASVSPGAMELDTVDNLILSCKGGIWVLVAGASGTTNFNSAVVGTPGSNVLRDRPTVADFGATGEYVSLGTVGLTAAGSSTIVTGNASLAARFAPLSNGVQQGVFVVTGGMTCSFTATTHSGSATLDGITSPGTLFACNGTPLTDGAAISGTGIPLGATIASLTYGQAITTSLVMSAVATASATVTVTETLPDYVGTVTGVSGATLSVTPPLVNAVASGTAVQRDDTYAIMAARDSCEAKFQVFAGLQWSFPIIRFPPGKYNISSPIPLKSCGTRGDSAAPTTAIYWNGSPANTIGAFYVPSVAYGFLGNGAGKELANLRFEPGRYQPKNWLVSDSYIDQGFRAEALHFIDATESAVYLKYGWANLHWHNLRWDGNSGAFHLVPLATQYASSFLVEDFTFATSTYNANPANYFTWIDNSTSAIYLGTLEFSNARIEIDTSPGWNASGQKSLFYITQASAFSMGLKMNGINYQNNNGLTGDSVIYNGTGNQYFSASLSIDNSVFAGMNYFVSPAGSLYAGGLDLPFQGGIRSIAVVSGGTGYTNGDTITVAQSGAGGGLFTVTASGGVVSALTLASRGYDYSIATPLATTGGTGTGLTVNISAVTMGAWDPLGINPISGLAWNPSGASLSDYGTRNITGSVITGPALTMGLKGELFPRRIDLVSGYSSYTNGSSVADLYVGRSGSNAWSCGSTAGTGNCTINVGNIYGLSLRGTGSAPTAVNGIAAGTSPGTPTVTGTNLSHIITVITGSSPTAGASLATVTFYGTLASAANACVLTPRNAAAAAQTTVYTTAPSTTNYALVTGGAPLAASTTYVWGVQCF